MKIWKWIFYTILIIFPFGQLVAYNPPLKNLIFRVHPLDVAAFLFVIYWFFFIKKSKPPFFFKSLSLFGVIAGLSLAVNAPSLSFGGLVQAFFYLLRLYCWILFFWAIIDFLKKQKIDVTNLLVFEGLVISIISILQYIFIPDTRFLFYSGWDDHYFRAIGSFLDPSFNGLILVLSFILCLKKYFKIKNNKKICYLFFLILICVAVGLTFSRMSYLVLVISFFLIFLYKKRFDLLFFFVSIFILLIILIPKPTGEGVNLLRTSSGFAKILNYQQILSISKNNLIFGVGYNSLRNEYFKTGFLAEEIWQDSHSGAGSDNSFLFVLATTGILGFFSYLYFWFKILKKSYLQKEIYLFSSLICLLVSSFFINSLFYPWVLFWLGVILAEFTAGTEA